MCLTLFMETADKIALSHTVKHGELGPCGVATPTQDTTVKRHQVEEKVEFFWGATWGSGIFNSIF